MDALREFLDDLKRQDAARQLFVGLLHILIGRRISKTDGTVISAGMTWRELAALLKRLRWDKEAARQVGLDPEALPPRDRERYWYLVIARAQVDSPQAIAEGDRLAELMKDLGYVIGPAPGGKGPGTGDRGQGPAEGAGPGQAKKSEKGKGKGKKAEGNP